MIHTPPTTDSQQQWGNVTADITPMNGWGSWGRGLVQFKTKTGDDDGSPIEVENRFPTLFAATTSVYCDRSFTPPRVVRGHGLKP